MKLIRRIAVFRRISGEKQKTGALFQKNERKNPENERKQNIYTEKYIDYNPRFFTTTLTISPLKNAQKLNEIGHELEREIGVPFLPSDFKKKNGYKRSIELSEQYGLYRQDYCGCAYSKAEREKKK